MDLKSSRDYTVRLRKEITVSNSQYEVSVSLLPTRVHGRAMIIVVFLAEPGLSFRILLDTGSQENIATNQFPSV